MRRRVFASVLALLLLATLMAWPAPSSAQPGVADTFPPYQANYFEQTGHSAVNWFLQTWRDTPNALFVYGMPISQPFVEESFTNPGQFYRVQYFERAVLEEHAENFGQQNNKFYVLGRLLGSRLVKGREGEPAFQPKSDPGDGTFDVNSQHTLRNGPAPFRDFWLQNGGLDVFGRPLSEQFQEVNAADGQTYWVQYFERQRMEWHPDEPDANYRIQLGLLGNEARKAFQAGNPAFDSRPVDQALPQPFVYGYNAFLFGAGSAWQDRGRALTLVKNSGFGWVRQQVQWRYMQSAPGTECYKICWGELDGIAADASAMGVKVLVSVVQSPDWATGNGTNGLPSRDNYGEFANFMGQMAARYKGRIQAYEIWNEQNLAHENGGVVANADNYVDMLAMAYDAIKANDANAIVVSGAPSSTETNKPNVAISDVTFYSQMFNNPRFRSHVDAVGAHPGGQLNPPDAMWPSNPGPGPGWVNSREFYFRRLEDVRQVMLDNGMGDKQVWVTEFGWATPNTTPGYEYGNFISFDTQAQYIVRAFELGRRNYAPWVGAMFLWQLNFAVPWRSEGNELHEQASFGVINGDWSPRPSYLAIQQMPKD